MKKKLKIAMFFSSNPEKPDGLLHHIYYISQELTKLGHLVYLFGPNRKSALPFKNYKKITNLVEVPFFKEATIFLTVKSKEYNEPVKTIENQAKFDLIHIHDPYLPLIAWEILKKAKLPIVTTFHTAWDESSRFNIINGFIPLFQDYFKKVSGSIFVSKIGIKRWGSLLPAKVKKIVINNGVHSNLFYPLENKNKKITLLFVARIVPRKGLMILLKTLRELIKDIPNIKLIVLGDGPHLITCKKYVKNNQLENFVEFKGYITGKNKIKYYQNSDIFCAPYRNENFAITILEAMSCGIPIVGFDSNGVKEILSGYPDSDLIVSHKNTKLFREAIKSLVLDDSKRKRIRKWLLTKREKYSWEKIAKETEEFYYKVLKI
ncbi:Glycosyl transferase, group 1 family protein [Candidatus Roizmanbacteria bacterium]|nr:Glycosyl transferase, group 1 family protein [Candidatus Roizmanbacteria bacterium]